MTDIKTPHDRIAEALARHEAAVERRQTITRLDRKDPGPQPGELSSADFEDLYQAQSILGEDPWNAWLKDGANDDPA